MKRNNIKALKDIIEPEIKEEVQEDIPQEASDDEVIEKKPAKQKKAYVLTEARKLQFEKARMVRQANVLLKKLEKEGKQTEIKNLEIELKNKQDMKVNKKKNQIIKQIADEESSDEEEDEIIIKKSKPKPKSKKVVYVKYESSSEDEPERKPMKKAVIQKRDLRPIIQYM